MDVVVGIHPQVVEVGADATGERERKPRESTCTLFQSFISQIATKCTKTGGVQEDLKLAIEFRYGTVSRDEEIFMFALCIFFIADGQLNPAQQFDYS
jgi:hypothetical protein